MLYWDSLTELSFVFEYLGLNICKKHFDSQATILDIQSLCHRLERQDILKENFGIYCLQGSLKSTRWRFAMDTLFPVVVPIQRICLHAAAMGVIIP